MRPAVRFGVPPFDVCDRTAQVSVLNVKVSCFPETMNESFPTFFGNVGGATEVCSHIIVLLAASVESEKKVSIGQLSTGCG